MTRRRPCGRFCWDGGRRAHAREGRLGEAEEEPRVRRRRHGRLQQRPLHLSIVHAQRDTRASDPASFTLTPTIPPTTTTSSSSSSSSSTPTPNTPQVPLGARAAQPALLDLPVGRADEGAGVVGAEGPVHTGRRSFTITTTSKRVFFFFFFFFFFCYSFSFSFPFSFPFSFSFSFSVL